MQGGSAARRRGWRPRHLAEAITPPTPQSAVRKPGARRRPRRRLPPSPPSRSHISIPKIAHKAYSRVVALWRRRSRAKRGRKVGHRRHRLRLVAANRARKSKALPAVDEEGGGCRRSKRYRSGTWRWARRRRARHGRGGERRERDGGGDEAASRRWSRRRCSMTSGAQWVAARLLSSRLGLRVTTADRRERMCSRRSCHRARRPLRLRRIRTPVGCGTSNSSQSRVGPPSGI